MCISSFGDDLSRILLIQTIQVDTSSLDDPRSSVEGKAAADLGEIAGTGGAKATLEVDIEEL